MVNGGGTTGGAVTGCHTATTRPLLFFTHSFLGGGGSGGCKASFHWFRALPIGASASGSNAVRGACAVISVGEFDAITVQRCGPSAGMNSISQSPLAINLSPTSRSSQDRAGLMMRPRATRQSDVLPSIALI